MTNQSDLQKVFFGDTFKKKIKLKFVQFPESNRRSDQDILGGNMKYQKVWSELNDWLLLCVFISIVNDFLTGCSNVFHCYWSYYSCNNNNYIILFMQRFPPLYLIHIWTELMWEPWAPHVVIFHWCTFQSVRTLFMEPLVLFY